MGGQRGGVGYGEDRKEGKQYQVVSKYKTINKGRGLL